MRIIFITSDDYANFGFYKSESLKSVGIDSESFVLQPHPFNYDKHSTLVNGVRMKEEIMKADIIHIVHSDITALRLCEQAGKPYYVWHTGTRFRQSPSQMNDLFKNANGVFYALGEFESLCNGDYFSITVDTDSLPFTETNNNKLIFSHHPSNAQVKGSDTIINIFNGINSDKFETNINTNIIPYTENLQRIKQCDVYVEMCAITQGGKPYGSFGTTSVECASMGKIVITNSLWDECYNKYYGNHSLIIANSPHELREKIIWLSTLDKAEINKMKLASREWAVSKHGYKATANRLIKYL